MGYKRKWNIKNNSFIQYFNKLHEKKKKKKGENCIWHVIKRKKKKEKSDIWKSQVG